MGIPWESLDVPKSLLFVVCSDEVGASLEVDSDVEFSDRLLSSEEEEVSKSSEVRTLE